MKTSFHELVCRYGPCTGWTEARDFRVVSFYNVGEVRSDNVQDVVDYLHQVEDDEAESPWLRREEIYGPICLVIKSMMCNVCFCVMFDV